MHPDPTGERWVWRLVVPALALLLLLAACLVLPALVHADAFDRAKRAVNVRVAKPDGTGFNIRGGASLDTGTQARTTVLLRGQATTGGGCGAFDFAASLKEAFEEIPQIFESVGNAVLQNVPMLVACYISPVLCDAMKHAQALVNASLTAKYARCEQIQTAMGYVGSRLRGGNTSACLEYQANLGIPLSKAMSNCLDEVPFLRSPFGDNRQHVNLIEETLGAAGADQEIQALAKNLFGEMTLRTSGRGLGHEQTRPQQVLMERYEAHRQEANETVQAALNEIRDTGDVSEETLARISVPGQPVPVAVIQALSALERDRARRDAYLDKITTGLAVVRLTWECDELQEQLAASVEANVQLSDEQRRAMEKRLEGLRRDLQRVIAKKEVIERHLQPAYHGLLDEYARLQDYAAQAGLRTAGTPAIPPTPYGRQHPSGVAQ